MVMSAWVYSVASAVANTLELATVCACTQLVMVVVVTTIALALHLWYKPYAVPKLQRLETLSLSVSLTTFVVAQLLLASGNQGDISEHPVSNAIVTVALVAANVIFVVAFVMTVRHEVLDKVRSMMWVLYCARAPGIGSCYRPPHVLDRRSTGEGRGATGAP